MKPSLDHQYQVSILSLDNVIVVVIKNYKQYITNKDLSIYQRSTDCTVTWLTTSFV